MNPHDYVVRTVLKAIWKEFGVVISAQDVTEDTTLGDLIGIIREDLET